MSDLEHVIDTTDVEEAGVQPANLPATTRDAQAIMGMLDRLIGDPSFDVLKAEKLMDLYARAADRQAAQDYQIGMNMVQKELEPIRREGYNEQTRSKYAKLDNVVEAVMPIATKYGFNISFGSDKSDIENHYGVTCEVGHNSGHIKKYRYDVPADLFGSGGKQTKTNTHAWASAQTYGRRYLLVGIFSLSTGATDDDGNAANRPFAGRAPNGGDATYTENYPGRSDSGKPNEHSQEQMKRAAVLLSGSGKSEAGVLAWYNQGLPEPLHIRSIKQIHPDDFPKLVTLLESAKRRMGQPV